MTEVKVSFEEWSAGREERRREAQALLEALGGTLHARSRPRDPDEWDWLKSKGVPESQRGPRWTGSGRVPRYPPKSRPSK